MGDGWLSSDESFVRMKKFLNSTKLNFLTADINSIECHPCDTVIASNISQFKRVSSKCNLIHANNKGHYAQSRFLSYKGKPKNKKVVLYKPRNNLSGSIVCHLGEIHLKKKAKGKILDTIKIKNN